MDRRQFLKRGTFFTIVAAGAVPLVGCSDSDTPPPTTSLYAFPQGVASGDPRESSLVFWSRCVPRDGTDDPVLVRLDVSTSADFATVLATAPLQATSLYDHTVRAKIINLPAATTLYYRFVAGSNTSPVGTARTAPTAEADLARMKFAWFTCQDWSVNHWGAMSLMAAETDLDFIVHVGDYVYETVGAAFQAGAAEPSHTAIAFPDGTSLGPAVYATTLEDYRTLYRTYRGDPRLQALHLQWPMIAIWDDHEFSDDAWKDHQTYTNENRQQTDRRRSASQAWIEYMPIDFGDVAFDTANEAYDNIRIYRDFRFGRLMHLVMTDERLYRDDHVVPEADVARQLGHDPVNGNDAVGARYFVQTPVLQFYDAQKTAMAGGIAPSILGATQTAWWKKTLQGSGATWKIWGNEVMLSPLRVDLTQSAPPPYNANYTVNADAWDGYPTHKADLLGFLRDTGISNVVAITGDLHAFQCGVVRDVPVTGTRVLVDFVCAGISSASFYSYLAAGAAGTPLAALVATPQTFEAVVGANNPDLAYHDHDAQGYATATVTPTQMTVLFSKVKPLNADGTVPEEPLAKRTQITLAAGGTTPPVIVDNA